MKYTDPIIVALLRSLVGAILVAGTYYFANDVALFSKTVMGIGFVYIATRGGIEGIFDQLKKPRQNEPPATDFDGPGGQG